MRRPIPLLCSCSGSSLRQLGVFLNKGQHQGLFLWSRGIVFLGQFASPYLLADHSRSIHVREYVLLL